jgi:methyltransferase (TIGR00027 family)
MTQIKNVSDTARWVAVYRANESARPDAIFRDPFAARLAGEHGERIVATLPGGVQMSWAIVVRTKAMDDMIRDRVLNHGADVVLDLATGLDARPWRMTELPSTLRWIDVDLPGILDYKLETLAGEKTVCQYEAVRLDLRDVEKRRALFDQVGRSAKRVLVITEGLLIYLDAEQVADLARDLHAPPSFQWWMFDLIAPQILAMITKSVGGHLSAGNAPMKFAPANGTRFFEEFGWRELEYHSALADAQRLKREMRMMPFYRLLGRIFFIGAKKRWEDAKRMSGNVLMQRA